MAIEVTEEMRQAVYAADCARYGHQYNVQTAITGPQAEGVAGVLVLGSSADPDQAPHLSCSRCGAVWIVVEDGAADYDTAETELLDRLKPAAPLAAKVAERRTRRLARPARTAADLGHTH